MIAVRWFMPILVGLVAATWHVVPWLSPRELLFGATVTEEFRERERPALVREYELRLLPWTIAAMAGPLLLSLVTRPFWIWDIGFWLAVVLGGGWNVWRMFNCMPRAARGAARVRSAELTVGGCTAATWLMRIAINLQRDYWRNRRTQFWRDMGNNALAFDETCAWLP